jgi:class 3 adenylate cyclase
MTAACRLTATLAADVVGYSRLVEKDEAGTAKRQGRLCAVNCTIVFERRIALVRASLATAAFLALTRK